MVEKERKKEYERAVAELINIDAEKTLFTESQVDQAPDDGHPGEYYDPESCASDCGEPSGDGYYNGDLWYCWIDCEKHIMGEWITC